MRFSLLGLFFISLNALADAPKLPAPFEQPFARLKAGPVHFECREPASVNGFGQHRLRFDLILEPQTLASNVVVQALKVKNLEQGIWHYNTQSATYSALRFPADLAHGEVLAEGTEFERILLEGHYQGKPIPPELGRERAKKLSISQDIESKLVFARYTDTNVVDHGLPGCKPQELECEWRQRVLADLVYLCEAK